MIDNQQAVASTSSEQYLHFLFEIFDATLKSRGNPQKVYPLLQMHLDKLNDNLVQALHCRVNAILLEVEQDQAQDIAAVIGIFSSLIQDFPLGNRAINLEIAITGHKMVASFFPCEAFPEEWGESQNNLGTAYLYRTRGDRAENIEKAISYYKAALKVRLRESFPEEWAATQNNLAVAYLYRIRGDRAENLEMAIAAYTTALQVYTLEAFPEQWAAIQDNLGNVYQNRIRGNSAENLEIAITLHQAALQIYTTDTFPKQWAITHNNIGNAYRNRISGERSENLETAIAAYKKALQIRTRKALPEQWLETQINLGNAYYERINDDRVKNLNSAITAYESALQVCTCLTFPEKWAMIQNNLGNVYYELKQIDEAIKFYRSALEIYTPLGFPIDCLGVGRNLGYTAFTVGQWQEAIEGYGVAIKAIEQSRNWTATDTRRQEILSDTIAVYFNIVQAYINTRQLDKAFEYVERSKARNLVELLANRDLYPKGNISETVLNELKRLRREVVAEQRRLDIAEHNRSGGIISGTGEPTLDSAAWLKDRDHLNELLQQLDNLIATEIDPIDPNFRATQQVKPISSNEIQNLVDDRTTIVEWYITDENFHTFIITHQSQHPKVWSSSTEERQAFLDWQDKYLQDYQQNREQWIEKLLERLYRLSEILHIDDIINNLPSNCNQIILIPHRFLHLIPLHALPLSKGGCLLDRFPRGVRYAPSCQLLQLTQNQERINFDRLLAIQNPTQDLGYTSVEVGIIQHYFSRADIFVEDAAKKAALVEVKIKDIDTREVVQNSQLSLANCIHFSCHGEFNFESPLDSALLLAEGERLTLGEIFDIDLSQCRLVTLSACETGLTNYKILSDEYVGIPSSFLYAGSPSVVSSLWTVQNVSTAFLMIKFYQNISVCKKVAIALNQAQLWLRNLTKKELQEWISENKISLDATLNMSLRRKIHKMSDKEQPFKSPFHWAAFCAIGQ